MKEVTEEMIKDFEIMKLGYDFMGGLVTSKKRLTFHHLLLANRNGGPYEYWNGAILTDIMHQYLHVIEAYDVATFYLITSEIQDMKVKGYIDIENLKNIEALLEDFEYRYRYAKTRKGKSLIKHDYKKRILTPNK